MTAVTGLECTQAELPLDYDRPGGPTVGLALVRHPAADQAHRIGSVFVNPGGPGASGVEFLRTAPPGEDEASVEGRFTRPEIVTDLTVPSEGATCTQDYAAFPTVETRKRSTRTWPVEEVGGLLR